MNAPFAAVTVTQAATEILPARFSAYDSRRGFALANTGANTVYIHIGAGTPAYGVGIPMLANGTLTIQIPIQEQVRGICNTGLTTTVVGQEL